MSHTTVKLAAETVLCHLWARYRNCDYSVSKESVGLACEEYRQAHLAYAAHLAQERRVQWEARERANPGIHARAKAERNARWFQRLGRQVPVPAAAVATEVTEPTPFPELVDREQQAKIERMWTCRCGKHLESERILL